MPIWAAIMPIRNAELVDAGIVCGTSDASSGASCRTYLRARNFKV
jgi:hypothetical protein